MRISEPKVEIYKRNTEETIDEVSEFSISNWMNKKENKKEVKEEDKENLPQEHFSQMDVEREWELYLKDLREKDAVKYSAVKVCKLEKLEEEIILVKVPSGLAKLEFKSIQKEYLTVLQTKVNNFHIKIKYKQDESLKKEVITKKKMFDKFAEKNPVLLKLDDLMKFDFS